MNKFNFFYNIPHFIKRFISWAFKFILILYSVLIGILYMFYIYVYHISDYGIELKVQQMYQNILAKTGQTQDALPLIVMNKEIDNAYTNGNEIVIYSGFIRLHNWDEIALVLGHEIAHGMLAHLNANMPIPDNLSHAGMGSNDFVSVLEANADKMGAFYMMAAGYDICKGREIFKTWKKRFGNMIGQDHPNSSYRYEELKMPWCGD